MTVNRNKKIIIAVVCTVLAVCIIVGVVLCWKYLVLPIGRKYGYEGAAQLALDYYEMDEVLFAAHLQELYDVVVDDVDLVDGVYTPYNEFSEYYIFVLGLKDGEETAILAPRLVAQEHHRSAWFFDVSFRDTMKLLNNDERGNVFPPERYSRIKIYNAYLEMEKIVPNIKEYELDKRIMLVCDNYAIVQSRGEIVIIETENA